MILGQVGPAYARRSDAYCEACDHADKTKTPCGVWSRDGWHIASEIAPDMDDADTREADGWVMTAVADPIETVDAWGV